MPALSIRHMNFTLQTLEHIRAQQDAEWYASLPADKKSEQLHYWHIERKAKRKKNGKTNWIFVRHLYATKHEAAEVFTKRFGSKEYRLRHILAYQ